MGLTHLAVEVVVVVVVAIFVADVCDRAAVPKAVVDLVLRAANSGANACERGWRRRRDGRRRTPWAHRLLLQVKLGASSRGIEGRRRGRRGVGA